MTVAMQPVADRKLLGASLIVIAVFMMSVQDALVKHYSGDLSLWQIFTLRGVLAIPLLLLVAMFMRQQQGIWRGAMQKWALIRSVFMVLMYISLYAAIPFLSLSVIAAGFYTGPIFVTLLSAFLLGEPVSRRGWLAIAVGFIGVLVILQPGGDAFTAWALIPVFGGLMYALTNVTTRSKCQTMPMAALALSLTVMLLLLGAVFSLILYFWQGSGDAAEQLPFLLGGWSETGWSQWLLFLVLAFLTIGISITLVGAYQVAPPPLVATFDYSYLVFVGVWDFLFFNTVPSITTLCGMLLIIAAGLLVTIKR
ncbi:DMT family transporter [Aliamphritea ceti]|uniref:DMT family transporter n=1 Tax=Aliamphritea ceti TaxID=1524258 RepID=UPI0021C28167|nr:DMT family transporter [Aliamphritea ceti]